MINMKKKKYAIIVDEGYYCVIEVKKFLWIFRYTKGVFEFKTLCEANNFIIELKKI
jgi:hypothetical protein